MGVGGGQVHSGRPSGSGEGQGASLGFLFYNMTSTHYFNDVLCVHVCMCLCHSTLPSGDSTWEGVGSLLSMWVQGSKFKSWAPLSAEPSRKP